MSDVNLGTVKAKLEIDSTGVDAGVEKARSALEGFGASADGVLGQLKEGYAGVSASMAETTRAAGIAAGAIGAITAAAGLAAKAIADAAVAGAEYVEALDKMALSTGLSTDLLQSLGKAADETNTSTQTLMRAVARLEAAVGNDSKAFQALGLSLEDLKASSPEAMLRAVAERLLSMTDVTERNAAAQKLFGRAYIEVLPALQAYLQAGDRYVNLNEDQQASLRSLDAALDANSTAWKEVSQQLGAVAAQPEVISLIKDIGSAVRELAITIQDNREGIAFFFNLITGRGAYKAGAGIRESITAAISGIPKLEKPAEGITYEQLNKLNAPPTPFIPPGEISLGEETPEQRAAKRAYQEDIAEAERAAKRFQTTLDTLSGAKAQAEVDLIAQAVGRLGVEGVADIDTLSKKLLGLADQGAKLPPVLDSIAQKAAMDQVEGDYAKMMANIVAIKPEREGELGKWLGDNSQAIEDFNERSQFLAEQTASIEAAYMQATTSAHRNELDARVSQIQAYYDRVIADSVREAQAHGVTQQEIAKLVQGWKNVAAAEIEAAQAAARYAEIGKILGGIGEILSATSQLFTALGMSAESALGKIMAGAEQVVGGLQGVVAGLASGNIFQAIAGGIQAITGIVGTIKGLFSKPEYKKVMSDVGKSWGVEISEGLAKEIANIEKTYHVSRTMAELLDISKIMEESGKDPREFTNKINDLMNAIALGSVPAKVGLAELGKAFAQVAEAALESGNIGDAALVQLIKRARELGQVTSEMSVFIEGQLNSAVEGINSLVKAMPVTLETGAGGQAALMAATFSAMAAEKGIVAASQALGPAYDDLMAQISKAGLAIPEALQSIGRQMQLGRNEQYAGASTAAAATSQVLAGLANAGYMDAGALAGAGDVAKQAFDQAKAAGATDKEAYELIGSLLADIKNASIQSGIAMTDVEQELISGATAQGVKIGENQLSVLVDIRNILSSQGRASEAYYAPPEVPSYQHGGVGSFGRGTLVRLHGREAIVPLKQQSIGATPIAAAQESLGGGVSVTQNVSVAMPPWVTQQDRRQFAMWVSEEVKRAARTDPSVRLALQRATLGGRP